MRYPASEKLEIIRLVEESTLPVRRTLEKIGIPRATFYRWYDLYQTGGPEALEDQQPKPDRVWNRIPDDVRERIIRLALDEPALSPREQRPMPPDLSAHCCSTSRSKEGRKTRKLFPRATYHRTKIRRRLLVR